MSAGPSTRTSGERGAWLNAVAGAVMAPADGRPPDLARLGEVVPDKVGTAHNDGHVTAAQNGHDRGDVRAGWAIIIEEVVGVLVDHELVVDRAGALTWAGSPNGRWPVKMGRTTYTVNGLDSRAESAIETELHLARQGLGRHTVIVQTGSAANPLQRVQELELHELAMKLPPMTEEEFRRLHDDIAQNGVRVPLMIYKGKVLDGRHRLGLAAVLGKPVRLEHFRGSEAEARDLVMSLNLARRHLNLTQLAQLAVEFVLPAEREAAILRRREGQARGGKSGPKSGPTSSTSEGGKAYQETARKMGGSIAPSTIERYDKHVHGKDPEVEEKVRAGEIRSVEEAVRLANPERPAPPAQSAFTLLGRVRSHLDQVLADEPVPDVRMADRVAEVDERWAAVKRHLRGG